TDAEPLAPRRMVDLDHRRCDADDVPFLPDPGCMLVDVAAPRAEEDPLERGVLPVVRAVVDVEEHAPGRARLVVRVAEREHHAESVEPDAVRLAVLDQPGEDAETDSVRRTAAAHAVDPAAGTDCVAIARLEVGPADVPAHLCMGMAGGGGAIR